MGSVVRGVKRRGKRGKGADVIQLRPDTVRALQDVMRSTPELGVRTPQPTMSHHDRVRFHELTFERLTRVMRRAVEDGETADWVDLTLRMRHTDAHLHAVWETRNAPVIAARDEVTPAPGAADSAPAERLAQACDQVIASLPEWPRVKAALLDGDGVGHGVAEIQWGRGALMGVPAWVPVAVTPCHPRRFRYADTYEIGLWDDGQAWQWMTHEHAEGRLAKPPAKVDGARTQIVELPAGKYIVHQPLVATHDYPSANGVFFACARWWWVKQKAITYWLAGAEVAANPRLIGHILQAAQGATMTELHEGLEKLAADGVAVFREGTSAEMIPGQAQSSADVWLQLIRTMDDAMTKAILGSTLNTEVGDTGGNRALGESQAQETIRPRQENASRQMWASVGQGMFRYVRDYNPHLFPPDTPLPMGQSILSEPAVEVDQLIVDAGGVEMDELRESRGLTPWGDARGKRVVRPLARSVSPGAFRQASEVAEPVPLSNRAPRPMPWELAAQMSRALTRG